jgi:hypothetical protein
MVEMAEAKKVKTENYLMGMWSPVSDLQKSIFIKYCSSIVIIPEEEFDNVALEDKQPCFILFADFFNEFWDVYNVQKETLNQEEKLDFFYEVFHRFAQKYFEFINIKSTLRRGARKKFQCYVWIFLDMMTKEGIDWETDL